jgi:tetratricopeptide (TPR) repeat protein
MHPSLLILLIGVLYILGFGGISFVRRQGPSSRFLIEGLVITAAGTVFSLASVSLHPALFLAIIYLVTMRVRILIDLGNLFINRQWYGRALALFHLAVRLWPDAVSRQIVLINRGVAQLRMHDYEAAYLTLSDALTDKQVRPGARYLAAGCYNLGLACRRTGREAEAIRRFNEAIDTLPYSAYANGARQALKRSQSTTNRT